MKTYVLDTCVLIHDPSAIFKFGNNNVIIPMVVLDELDKHKTANGSLGYHARKVLRILNDFDINSLISGIDLIHPISGKSLNSILSIYPHPEYGLEDNDLKIVKCCEELSKDNDSIILVTKDVGLRLRATVRGIKTENYEDDLILENSYKGIKVVDITNYKLNLYNLGGEFLRSHILSIDPELDIKDIYHNEFVLFRFGNQITPTIFNAEKDLFKIIKEKDTEFPIQYKNIEQLCSLYALNCDDIKLVCIQGRAGSGKSFMSIATGLKKIEKGLFSKIVYIKPIIPVSNKDLGYLPGSKMEKVSEWIGPLKDNISQLNSLPKGAQDLEGLIDLGYIEVEVMTYIQGRSIPKAFIIIDESQNLSKKECRMLVERCGEDSKIVFLGDLSQIENPYLDEMSSGLNHTIQGSKNVNICASIELTKVERSQLAAAAPEIYK